MTVRNINERMPSGE